MDPEPVLLSLQVAGLATVFVALFGTPLAWLLGRHRFRGQAVLETLVLLPLVLPPTVLGYGLLVLLGREGAVGGTLSAWGIEVLFTWKGAVLAAWLAGVGLYVRSAQAGFEQVDAGLEAAARTLGRSGWNIFWTVTLPLARRAVLAGVVLAFCRAVGEFGITLMVAGNIPGVTRTIPLAIYDQVQAGQLAQATQLSLATAGVVAVLVALVHRAARDPGA